MAEPWSDLRRVALISNTASGANRRLGLDAVRGRAAAAGLPHYAVDAIDELDGVLEQCARSGVRLLIVNAGDGTVCRLLDLLRGDSGLADEPAFALLRGGTTNMIHRDVGWKGAPDAALAEVLGSLARGRYTRRERHVLRVRQASTGLTRHGFFFATHAVVRAILRTRAGLQGRITHGALPELLSTAGMVWRLLRRRVEDDPVLSPVPLEIACNGEPWRRINHILLMATSLRRMILGVRPLPAGQPAGLAGLEWPGYRLLPWLRRFTGGRLEALESVSLRGELDWILDGEVYRHGAADGTLSLDVARPARFVVAGAS